MMHYNKWDIATPSDWITASEFDQYYKDIFHADVIRLAPNFKLKSLMEINSAGKKAYKVKDGLADKGSKIYELYIQYPENGTAAESFFSFIFAKIKGQYKVIGYYSKWPIK
jgi:hypothetical protein